MLILNTLRLFCMHLIVRNYLQTFEHTCYISSDSNVYRNEQ